MGASKTSARWKAQVRENRRSLNKSRAVVVRAESFLGDKPSGSRRYSRKTMSADPLIKPMRSPVSLTQAQLRRGEMRALKRSGFLLDRVRTKGGTTKKLVRSFGAITSGRNNIRKFR